MHTHKIKHTSFGKVCLECHQTEASIRKGERWNIPEPARKFHYWRGFAVGAIAGGLVVFVIMANIIINTWGN